MEIGNISLVRLSDTAWEIPREGGMLVPGRVYATAEMLRRGDNADEPLRQVINVAHLPGIQKYALAMPDMHWGYGFPIGGVAATDASAGVISPGGVGYDINCGVRLALTSLPASSVRPKIDKLVSELFKAIPTGVGARGAIQKLGKNELRRVAESGARWAIERDYGRQEDIECTEENGRLRQAQFDAVSERAIERGLDQLGTLGSGNHFLEIDIVDEIYDAQTASAFGMFEGQIAVLIHTGSRGFGYQICEDYLKLLLRAADTFGIRLPDKQLACAPLASSEGKAYLSAMAAAANFAWNNRSIITGLAKRAFLNTFHLKESELGFTLLYDVCHNIAKMEEHSVQGTECRVCVHRKGATRAFPPGSPYLSPRFRATGQPVLIPGDMGRYSFVCVGTNRAMEETFGSSCHGAGRLQSRTKALKAGKGRNLVQELYAKGISIQAHGYNTIAEEMPEAYKDVAEVVDVMHRAGITPKVARLKPIGVIKG